MGASVESVSSFELCKIIPVEETTPKFNMGDQGSNTCNRYHETMTSETECKDEVTAFFGKTWNRKDSWDNYPKGCFMAISNEMIYFNTHATGRGNGYPGAKKICKHEEFFLGDGTVQDIIGLTPNRLA